MGLLTPPMLIKITHIKEKAAAAQATRATERVMGEVMSLARR